MASSGRLQHYVPIKIITSQLVSFQVSFAYHAGSFRRGGRIHGIFYGHVPDGTLMGIFLFQGIFVCLDLVKKCRYPGPYSGDTQTLGVCHRHTSS